MGDNGSTSATPGPGTMLAHDPAGPGTIGWEEMVEVERLACCLASVLARLQPLDAQRMRYNRNTRVASAWRDDPVDVERLKVWQGNKAVVLPSAEAEPRKQLGQWWNRPGETTESIIQKIGAAGGLGAVEETRRLTAPPRRWFGSRKKK